MNEVIVPLLILVALALIIILSRKWSKPISLTLEKEYAEANNFQYKVREFYPLKNSVAKKFDITGSLNGVDFKIEVTRSSGRTPGLSKLTANIPKMPQELSIKRTVGAREAMKRGKLKNRFADNLPFIWAIEGVSDQVALAIKNQTFQNLSNLFISYPHAKISNQQIQVEKVNSFGSNLTNTVALVTLIGQELNSIT